MLNKSRLALKVINSNFSDLKLPYKLNFYLTDRCNFRCKICNIWDKKVGNELNTGEISAFFRKNSHFSWIDITGGEIFLRKDIDEIFGIIISECRNLHLLHFPTHGFFTEKVCSSVKNIIGKFKGRLVVTISLDGPREVHNAVRGIDSWERAVATFRRLDALIGDDVFFGFTLSRHNVGKLDGLFSELKDEIPGFSMNRIHLNLAQASGHYYSNSGASLQGDKDDIVKEIDFLLSRRKLELSPFFFIETKFLRLLKKYALEGKHPLDRCSALNSTVTVNPEGHVYPCLFFNRRVGSLREEGFDLKKILLKNESMELKKDILGHCPHCWSACEAYPSIMSSLR